MAKADPNLWEKSVMERVNILKYSGILKKLSNKGLTICGRKKKYTAEEWQKSSFRDRYSSETYRNWVMECEQVAEKFGLASWTVINLCLITKYDSREALFPIESIWPYIRVITEQRDSLFIDWLIFYAHRLGLRVIQKQGQIEITHGTAVYSPPDSPLLKQQLPPRNSAFFIRVEFPLDFPTVARSSLAKETKELEMILCQQLGYTVTQRLRTSKLVDKAEKLRLEKTKLENRELFEIVADIFPEGDISEDNRRKKTVGTQRHRLRKKLRESD